MQHPNTGYLKTIKFAQFVNVLFSEILKNVLRKQDIEVKKKNVISHTETNRVVQMRNGLSILYGRY